MSALTQVSDMTNAKTILVAREGTKTVDDVVLEIEGKAGKSQRLYGQGLISNVQVVCCPGSEPVSLPDNGAYMPCQNNNCKYAYSLDNGNGKPVVRFKDTQHETRHLERADAYKHNI
mgnify:FL=1